MLTPLTQSPAVLWKCRQAGIAALSLVIMQPTVISHCSSGGGGGVRTGVVGWAQRWLPQSEDECATLHCVNRYLLFSLLTRRERHAGHQFRLVSKFSGLSHCRHSMIRFTGILLQSSFQTFKGPKWSKSDSLVFIFFQNIVRLQPVSKPTLEWDNFTYFLPVLLFRKNVSQNKALCDVTNSSNGSDKVSDLPNTQHQEPSAYLATRWSRLDLFPSEWTNKKGCFFDSNYLSKTFPVESKMNNWDLKMEPSRSPLEVEVQCVESDSI